MTIILFLFVIFFCEVLLGIHEGQHLSVYELYENFSFAHHVIHVVHIYYKYYLVILKQNLEWGAKSLIQC